MMMHHYHWQFVDGKNVNDSTSFLYSEKHEIPSSHKYFFTAFGNILHPADL